MTPDLLETIEPSAVSPYLTDEGWAVEEKLDGVRCLAVGGVTVTLMGRNGQELSDDRSRKLAELKAQLRIPRGFVLDGELMADGTYHVFDIPRAGDLITAATPYATRRQALATVLGALAAPRVILHPTATTADEKLATWERVQAERGEGVVLKRLDSPAPLNGKRHAWGLKAKLVKELDAVVLTTRADGTDSATFGLYDGEQLVEVGRVGIGGKAKAAIAPGDVICIRYLYIGSNGRLYQPRVVAIRSDKGARECLLTQMR
jgi:ATP-dependent DNA ligase